MDYSESTQPQELWKKSEIVTAAEPVRVVSKGWGEERWLVNIPSYCAKILFMNAGKKMSWHYHKEKEETFIVLEGFCEVVYGWDENISNSKSRKLASGDRFHVPVGLVHQVIAIESSKILEISTFHQESDSYRIIRGD